MSKTCSNLEEDAQKILWSNIKEDKYKNIIEESESPEAAVLECFNNMNITNREQMDVAWLIESDWNEYWHGCINPF
tara:strand:- start:403 stop:630 length:228 start_codon:yes stop_codon:yes gene_type:complete